MTEPRALPPAALCRRCDPAASPSRPPRSWGRPRDHRPGAGRGGGPLRHRHPPRRLQPLRPGPAGHGQARLRARLARAAGRAASRRRPTGATSTTSRTRAGRASLRLPPGRAARLRDDVPPARRRAARGASPAPSRARSTAPGSSAREAAVQRGTASGLRRDRDSAPASAGIAIAQDARRRRPRAPRKRRGDGARGVPAAARGRAGALQGRDRRAAGADAGRGGRAAPRGPQAARGDAQARPAR